MISSVFLDKLIKNSKFNPKSLNHLINILLGNLIYFFLSLLFAKLVSSFVTKNDYGIYSLFRPYSMILISLIYCGYNDGIGFFYKRLESNNTKNNFLINIKFVEKRLFQKNLLFTLITFTIALFFMSLDKALILLSISLFTHFEIRKDYNLEIFTVERMTKSFVFFKNTEILLKLVFLLLIARFFEINSFLFSMIPLISVYLISCIQQIRLRPFLPNLKDKQIDFKFFKKMQSNLNEFTKPYKKWTPVEGIYTILMPLILGYILKPSNFAIYTLYYQITYLPIFILLTSLIAFLKPKIYELENKTNNNSRTEMIFISLSIILLIFGFIITLFAHINGEKIFSLILSEQYMSNIKIISLFCMASFIAAISELYDFVSIARLNHNLLTSKKIINSICKSSIIIIFSLLYGLKGVGMGILSGEFLNVVYSFYILKSTSNKKGLIKIRS